MNKIKHLVCFFVPVCAFISAATGPSKDELTGLPSCYSIFMSILRRLTGNHILMRMSETSQTCALGCPPWTEVTEHMTTGNHTIWPQRPTVASLDLAEVPNRGHSDSKEEVIPMLLQPSAVAAEISMSVPLVRDSRLTTQRHSTIASHG